MQATLLLATLFAFFAYALAWTKEDYEIFDLVGAIEAAEGPGTTFYSWLEISPKANSADISRAYRKKSLALHPDKNPNVKGIQERYARLGVVTAILRDAQGRERYDFFFKNGVPRWRGTGYYYSRYRPGLGSVMAFLITFSSGLQLFILKYNYKKDLERIDRFVKKARVAAWGIDMVPQKGAKKVRLMLSERPGEDRSVEMVVEGDQVFLLGDGERVPLDATVANKPTITDTWAVVLVRNLLAKVVPGSKAAEVEDEAGAETSDGAEDTESAADTDGAPSTTARRSAVGMAGGRRRKSAPKKKAT